MKIFIVFLGLLLVNMSVQSYSVDFGRYAYLHRALDNIASECAEIAAYDVEEAWIFAEDMLAYTVKRFKNVNVKSYYCEINTEGGLVSSLVSMDVKNLFRFPFVPITSIVAEGKWIVLSEDMQYNYDSE